MADEANIELEYKFLNINVDKILKLLADNGAVFKFDTVYKIYNHDRSKWRSYQGRLRLREGNGIATMAYKAELASGFDEEIEFEIGDIERAHELINKLNIPLKRQEQKRRIRFELKGVEIDIDFWPDIDPYLEIEADTEEQIEEIARILELDMKDAVRMNAAKIYEKLSGKPMGQNVVFGDNDWRLSRWKGLSNSE